MLDVSRLRIALVRNRSIALSISRVNFVTLFPSTLLILSEINLTIVIPHNVIEKNNLYHRTYVIWPSLSAVIVESAGSIGTYQPHADQ